MLLSLPSSIMSSFIVLLDPCQCTAVQHAGTVTHGSCTHAGSWNDEHVAAAAKTSLSASSHTSISMESLPQSLTCTGTGEDRLASILCLYFFVFFAEEHPTLNPTKPCFDQGKRIVPLSIGPQKKTSETPGEPDGLWSSHMGLHASHANSGHLRFSFRHDAQKPSRISQTGNLLNPGASWSPQPKLASICQHWGTLTRDAKAKVRFSMCRPYLVGLIAWLLLLRYCESTRDPKTNQRHDLHALKVQPPGKTLNFAIPESPCSPEHLNCRAL